MGNYIYRVTSKTRKLPNGETANIAVFAYKPCSDWSEEGRAFNSKAHFKTGCVRSDALADKGKFSTWVIHGDPDAYDTADNAILKFDVAVGSYSDSDSTFRRYGKGNLKESTNV